jgi:hypothetical protein
VTTPKWLVIVRDLVNTGLGTFGISWLLVSNSINIELYLVFLSILGVPVGTHAIALMSATDSGHLESPEVSSSAESSPPSIKP